MTEDTRYIWQLRGSRLLLNFSTHCFSSYFLFFLSWGKITTLHLWDCDVTVGNFPTNESLDSYARAKRALVFLFVVSKKRWCAQLTFWHGEIKRNQFLNVFDGFLAKGQVNMSMGVFFQLLNWFGLMEVDGGFDLQKVPESWYSWKLGESPGFPDS